MSELKDKKRERKILFQQKIARQNCSSKNLLELSEQNLARNVLAKTFQHGSFYCFIGIYRKLARTFPAKTCLNCPSKNFLQNCSNKNLPKLSIQYNLAARSYRVCQDGRWPIIYKLVTDFLLSLYLWIWLGDIGLGKAGHDRLFTISSAYASLVVHRAT